MFRPGSSYSSFLRHRYILFNKPFNVLCQFTGEPPTLKDFIAVPDVYPVGRLDRDSEGLLLLTSDGALQRRLTDPVFAHPRTYWVQVEGVPTAEAMERLRNGIELKDKNGSYRSRPAAACIVNEEPQVPPRNPPVRYRKSIPTSWLELTLVEGRNRQVRRMTAAVHFPTLRLVRVASGSLRLGGLEQGVWRDLTEAELHSLRASGSRSGTRRS